MMKNKLNLDTLVKLYKRNSNMVFKNCYHCGRKIIVDKRELRVDNKCSSC